VGRRDFLDDPAASPANSLVPAASVVVVDDDGRILLHRRTDNNRWALPGGVMELGESIADCARREVLEETALTVELLGIIGIYSDPSHVFAYDDGEVRQEFSICFLAGPTGGTLT
jgi:ADP-ribose pyrophosphatase YjhB (NUDIX family)